MIEISLPGQVALVTGAASGIGRATALALARADVATALVDRNTAGLRETAEAIGALGVACQPFAYDLADWRGLPRLVGAVLERFGRIDILVNVAGVSGGQRPMMQVDAEVWDEVYTINLRSPFILMQEVARHVIARGGGGKMVNVSSSSSFRAAFAPPTYASAKAALNQLTRSAAAELAAHDINVNAVVPGLTNTPIIKGGIDPDKVNAGPLANLFKRISEPEDVAEAILFLCLPQSRQITGQMIHTSAGAVV